MNYASRIDMGNVKISRKRYTINQVGPWPHKIARYSQMVKGQGVKVSRCLFEKLAKKLRSKMLLEGIYFLNFPKFDHLIKVGVMIHNTTST